jgi:RHS repeat-associated protein
VPFKWVFHLLLLLACGVLQAQQQGTVTYVYTDPQGTPLAETDASGNIIKTYDYTPYGTTALGTSPNGPGYTGHVNDPETNLVYMQARYYDSASGRFLSIDPNPPSAGATFAFNRYAYASNNPIGNTDPNGKQTIPLANELGTDDPAVINRVQVAQLENANNIMDVARQLTEPLVAEVPELGAVPAAINSVADVTFAASKTASTIATASSDVPAAVRATSIAATMSPRTQRAVTIAVTETQEGTRVVSSSEGALRPAARAALQNGEVAARGVRGAHAEVNGIKAAQQMGLTPTGTAASRPICNGCASAMQQEGVVPLSPLKQQ